MTPEVQELQARLPASFEQAERMSIPESTNKHGAKASQRGRLAGFTGLSTDDSKNIVAGPNLNTLISNRGYLQVHCPAKRSYHTHNSGYCSAEKTKRSYHRSICATKSLHNGDGLPSCNDDRPARVDRRCQHRKRTCSWQSSGEAISCLTSRNACLSTVFRRSLMETDRATERGWRARDYYFVDRAMQPSC